jgi:hypothetical protein
MCVLGTAGEDAVLSWAAGLRRSAAASRHRADPSDRSDQDKAPSVAAYATVDDTWEM